MDLDREVQLERGRILSSPVFATSERSAKFLRYCVEQRMRREDVKETAVGVEVFGRQPDYDPKVDAIVRVQAQRVRLKLEQYYAGDGLASSVRISLPKGGYVPVVAIQAPEPSNADRTVETSLTRRKRYIFVTTLLVLAAAGLAAVALATLNRHEDASPFQAHAFTALASLPGLVSGLAVSPDGAAVAFAWSQGSGRSRIFVKRQDRDMPRPVTAPGLGNSEYRPVWSADGASQAFVRYTKGFSFGVWRTDLRSGRESKLGEFPYYSPLPFEAPSLDWSGDGKRLLISEQPNPGVASRLLLLDLSTGTRSALTSAGMDFGDFSAIFSPDGRHVAFCRGRFFELHTIDIAGESVSPPRNLSPGQPGGHGVAWSSDNELISTRATVPFSLWIRPSRGGSATRLTPVGYEAQIPAFSAKASYLAFAGESRTISLREVGVGGAPEQDLSQSPATDLAPAYSPVTAEIAFVSDRSGSPEVWMINRTTGHTRQLTKLHGARAPGRLAWSGDGQKLVFAVNRAADSEIAIWDRQADTVMMVATPEGSHVYSPRLDTAQQHLYYSADADGIFRVWRMPRTAAGWGPPEQVSYDSGLDFELSGDGRYLYFLDRTGSLQLTRRDLSTGNSTVLLKTDDVPYAVNALTLRGRKLYIPVASDLTFSETRLLELDLDSGRVSTAARVAAYTPGFLSNLALSPDAQRVVFSVLEQPIAHLYGTRWKH